jgi:hypothetical protein
MVLLLVHGRRISIHLLGIGDFFLGIELANYATTCANESLPSLERLLGLFERLFNLIPFQEATFYAKISSLNYQNAINTVWLNSLMILPLYFILNLRSST